MFTLVSILNISAIEMLCAVPTRRMPCLSFEGLYALLYINGADSRNAFCRRQD